MGFFLGKRTGNGWHVGYGSNGMHVGKSTPGGWYFGWSGGKRAKGAPMTPRERAVVAGIILIVAGLMWWGLSAWDAQIKADQQAKAQAKLTAALTEQLQAIDVMKYHYGVGYRTDAPGERAHGRGHPLIPLCLEKNGEDLSDLCVSYAEAGRLRAAGSAGVGDAGSTGTHFRVRMPTGNGL